jgi:hypothetical protein
MTDRDEGADIDPAGGDVGQQLGKRARVRALLIDPLEGLGFRRKGGSTVAEHQAAMDSLSDNLAYLSDGGLQALCEMLRTKGEGAARNVWPASATVYALAELIERRPIEELPGCLRWFRSVEGPRAMAAGTLVETWSYFHRMKRPPVHMGRELAQRAADNRRKLQIIDERSVAGVATAEEAEWARGYRDRLAYCEALVRGAGAADGAAA